MIIIIIRFLHNFSSTFFYGFAVPWEPRTLVIKTPALKTKTGQNN